ncbi:MAG: hypothetical protein K6G28_06680 [Acholeplasmatales bacterium]|nr:hypothetical protein [Acholeplasmatales bacterium]
MDLVLNINNEDFVVEDARGIINIPLAILANKYQLINLPNSFFEIRNFSERLSYNISDDVLNELIKLSKDNDEDYLFLDFLKELKENKSISFNNTRELLRIIKNQTFGSIEDLISILEDNESSDKITLSLN